MPGAPQKTGILHAVDPFFYRGAGFRHAGYIPDLPKMIIERAHKM
jgi:hypothetical protein